MTDTVGVEVAEEEVVVEVRTTEEEVAAAGRVPVFGDRHA